MTRKVPWSISYQLAAVRPERYPLIQPRSELVHTGDDPVMCGASHQWQVDRVAPWVPVRFRMRRLYLVLSPKDISRYGLGTWLMAECLFYSFLVFEQLEHMFYTDYTK